MSGNLFEHDIFLLMLRLSLVGPDQPIIDLFIESINSMQRDLRLRLLSEGENVAGLETIDISTPRRTYGTIAIDVDTSSPHDLTNSISSAVRMLAIQLENCEQQKIICEITELKQTENMNAESEKRLRDLFESVKDIILMVSASGDILDINPRAEEVTGYTHEELIRINVLNDLIIPEDRDSIQNVLKNLLEGKDQVYEVRWRTKTGEIVHFEGISSAWLSNEGNFISTRCILRDITYRKITEEALSSERNFVSAVLDTAGALVMVIDENARIVRFNKACENATGYTLEEVQGKPFFDILISDEETETVRSIIDHLVDGKAVAQHENHWVTKSGEKRLIAWSNTALANDAGQIEHIIASGIDITDQRRAVEESKWEAEVNLAMADLSHALLSSGSIDDVSRLILDYALCLTSSKLGFLGYVDHQTDYLIVPTMVVDDDQLCDTGHKVQQFKSFGGLWGWVLKNRKPLLSNSVSSDPRSTGIPSDHVHVERFLSAPALIGDALVGQIALANPSRPYDERDLVLVERMASLYALAIQRKRSEEALQESERFTRSTVDSLSASIAILDARGRILHTNRAWQNFAVENDCDMPPGMIGINYLNISFAAVGDDSDIALHVAEGIKDVIDGHRDEFNAEYPCHSPDVQRWFNVRVTRFVGEGPVRVVVAHENITERKQAEHALNALAAQQAVLAFLGQCALAGTDLSLLIDNATTLIARNLDVDFVTVLELVPEKGTLIFRSSAGWDDHDIEVDSPYSLLTSHADYTIVNRDPVVIEDIGRETRFDVSMLRSHGVSSGASVVVHGPNRPFGVLCAYTINPRIFTQDDVHFLQTVSNLLSMVLERAHADAHLRVQSSAINATSDLIVITNADGLIEMVNPAFESETGYTFGEVFGSNPKILKSGKQDERFYKRLWNTILAGNTWHGEVANRRKDGSLYTEDMTITPIKNEDGVIEHFVAIKRNITEKKMHEEQLNQSRKMETIGKLAAGIAHDFNNLLQGILGFTRVTIDREGIDETVRQDMKEVERASLRAADLVRQVLTFTRQLPGEREPVDINLLVEEAVALLRNTLPRTVRVNCRINSEKAFALADASQVHQVLMNLCLNSRDAMPSGGDLTIKVDRVSVDNTFITYNPWARKGEFVRCVVSDTGVGMDKDVKDRAIEPFYTTKSLQDGVGLGLSTCYGIIMGHNGLFHIDSEAGKGTAVSIFLPVANSDVKEVVRKETKCETRGSETVLLVDDEDYIQRLTERVLSSAGYTVLVAQNGIQALECVELYSVDIDLILLDLNMPEMDGIQTLSVIRRKSPKTKILVSTGLDIGIEKLPKDEQPDGLLQKPYSPETLLQAIREKLDQQ